MKKDNNPIKILIADDHPIFRRGLRSVIEQESSFVVVGEAENGAIALDLIASLKPDLVILDVDMPVIDGIEAAREIAKKFPNVKTTFLTLHRNNEILNALETMNIRGYLLKDGALLEIVNCVNRVMNGEIYVSQEIVVDVVRSRNAKSDDEKDINHLLKTLTPTEVRVLSCVARSMTSRETAEQLFISVRTVENHRFNICSKLDLRGSHSLVKFAIENKSVILNT